MLREFWCKSSWKATTLKIKKDKGKR